MIRGRFLNGYTDDLSECYDIRRKVFIEEQHVKETEEFDDIDQTCGHYVIYNEEDAPVATGRLIRIDDEHFQIGRVSTLKAYRHKGYAEFLMLSMIEKVRSLGGKEISLIAQISAIGFYEKCGFFVDQEEVIVDAGIEHKHMKYIVDANHVCQCCAHS